MAPRSQYNHTLYALSSYENKIIFPWNSLIGVTIEDILTIAIVLQ